MIDSKREKKRKGAECPNVLLLQGQLSLLREFSKRLEKRKIGISCNPGDWIISALEMVYGACQNLVNFFDEEKGVRRK